MRRLFGMDGPGPFKDGINDYVVDGRGDTVNPQQVGSKAALHYLGDIAPGASVVLKLRLSDIGDRVDLQRRWRQS